MNIERITNQITSNTTKVYLVRLDLKERNNTLHRICSKPVRLVLRKMPQSLMFVTFSLQRTHWTHPHFDGKYLQQDILHLKTNMGTAAVKVVLVVALLDWRQLCFIPRSRLDRFVWSTRNPWIFSI